MCNPYPESLGTIWQEWMVFWRQNHIFLLSTSCNWAQLEWKIDRETDQNLEKIQQKLVGWHWNVHNRCNSWVVHVLRVWERSDNFERSNSTQKWFFDFLVDSKRLFGTLGGNRKMVNFWPLPPKIGLRNRKIDLTPSKHPTSTSLS